MPALNYFLTALKGAFFFVIFLFIFSSSCLASDNLLKNPGFDENLLYGWTPSSGLDLASNFTISSFAKTGQYSASIKHNKTGSYGAGQIIKGIVGGSKYLGKGYVFFNNDKAKNARLRIAWYSSEDGSGPQIKTIDSNVISDKLSSWQELTTGTIEAPSTAKSIEFRILLSSTENEESLIYFDDLFFGLAEDTSSPSPSPIPDTSVSSPSNIFLSEFMPDPDENQEWVEIYNDNDFEATLQDWQIDDIEGGSSPENFSVNISPKAFKVINFSSSKLNNGGDSVRLINTSGEVVDSYAYSQSTKGKSWSKVGGSWCQTEPSEERQNNNCLTNNNSVDPSPSPSPSSASTTTSLTSPKTSPRASLAPSQKSSQKASFSPSPTLMVLPSSLMTASPEVLGEESGFNKKLLIPLGFMGAGSILLGVAFGPTLFKKAKERWYTHRI